VRCAPLLRHPALRATAMTARYTTSTKAIPCQSDCGSDERDSDSDNDGSGDGGSQTTKPGAMNRDAHRARGMPTKHAQHWSLASDTREHSHDRMTERHHTAVIAERRDEESDEAVHCALTTEHPPGKETSRDWPLPWRRTLTSTARRTLGKNEH